MTRPKALIFDKDGTLFDFGATWNVWALRVIDRLSGGDAALAGHLAKAVRYDPVAQGFLPDSPIIAGTNREAAECFLSALPGGDLAGIEALLSEEAARAPLAPAVPLAPLLTRLGAAGLGLAVMTNDAESAARAHLQAAGVFEQFDAVFGFDSGHGGKPSPTPLLALAKQMGVAPSETVMVGDSRHDLQAGRAAGMATVGVLTGMAGQADLAPLADVVLPDIGHLPGWLGL